jgi:DNA-binding transcriptional regulator YiaG
VKRNLTESTPTPDKTGSRAASTAHFRKLIAGWRRRSGLTREEAARRLCCTERTLRRWEAGRAMPRGFTLRAIVAAIEGGAL